MKLLQSRIFGIISITLTVLSLFACGSRNHDTPTFTPTVTPTPPLKDRVSQFSQIYHQQICGIYDAAWSPAGEMIAIGQLNGMRILNIENYEITSIGELDSRSDVGECEDGFIDGVLHTLTDIEWLPDAQSIAISTIDTIDFWNINTGEQLFFIHGKARSRSSLSDVDDVNLSWFLSLEEQISDPSDELGEFDISQYLITSAADWFENGIQTFSISPDGQTLVYAQNRNALGSIILHVIDLESRSEKMTLPGDYIRHNLISYSPDGRRFVDAGSTGAVFIRDAGTGDVLSRFGHPEGTVNEASWLQDGNLIATAGSSPVIYLWDPNTGDQVGILTGHTDSITALASAPSGDLLVSAGDEEDGTIRFWDIIDQAEVYQIQSYCDILEWSPDGLMLLSADADNLYVWGLPNE